MGACRERWIVFVVKKNYRISALDLCKKTHRSYTKCSRLDKGYPIWFREPRKL